MMSYSDRLGRKDPSNTAAPMATDTGVRGTVLGLLGQVLGETITEEQARRPFADLGLGSLLAVRLIEAINHAFDLRLGVETVFACPTPEALVAHLDAMAGGVERPRQEPVEALANGPSWGPGDRMMPIAVIGMAGQFGSATSVAEFWKVIEAGDMLVGPLSAHRQRLVRPLSDPHAPPPIGGFMAQIDRFDAAHFGLSPREAAAMDPQHRLFLEQAFLALEDGGYPQHRIGGENVGVFVGASPSSYEKLLTRRGDASDAWAMTGNLTALLASRISYHLDLGGPAITLDTACSSSLVALDMAAQSLARGDCALALAGGISLFLDPGGLELMQRAGMMSSQGRCASFDASADGIVPAEAVVALLLKPLDRARADGDRIDAVLLATATNQDGRSNGITAPNSVAQSKVITTALSRAGLSASDIDLIEAHGTGTPLGDPVEIAGLAEAFRARSGPALKIGTAKSNIGHTSEAAGLVGVVKAVLSLKHARIPPLAGFCALNPRIDLEGKPLAIAQAPQDWPRLPGRIRRVGVSSFGLAGTNAHAILAGADDLPPTEPAPSDDWVCLPISAPTQGLLGQRARDLADWLQAQKAPVDLAALSATLAVKRTAFACRAALVVRGADQALAALRHLAKTGTPPARDTMAPAELGAYALLFEQGDATATRNGPPSLSRNAANLSLPGQGLDRQSHWAFDPAPLTQDIPLDPADPVVSDHRLGGDIILHAAALLSIAMQTSDGGAIADFEWLQPVKVPDSGSCLHLSTAGDAVEVRQDDSPAPVARFATLSQPGEASPSGISRMLKLQSGIETMVSGGVAEPAPGVWLGPCYRGFDRLGLGPEGAIATLAAPEGRLGLIRALDAAIQASSALAAGLDGGAAQMVLRFPVGLKRLVQFAPVQAGPLTLIVTPENTTGHARDSHIDVSILDATGAPVIAVQGLCLRAMGQPVAKTAPEPVAEEPAKIALYRRVWRHGDPLTIGHVSPRATLIVAPAEDPLIPALIPEMNQDLNQKHGGDVTRLDWHNSDLIAALRAWLDGAPEPARLVLRLPRAVSDADCLTQLERGTALIHGIAQLGKGDLDVLVLADGAVCLSGQDRPADPWQAGLMALAQVVLGREATSGSLRCLDVPPGVLNDVAPLCLLSHPGSATGDPVVLRDGCAFHPRLEPLLPADMNNTPKRVAIIGGFGRIGRALAPRIAARWGADLALIGRAPIDPARQTLLDDLRVTGGQVIGVSADMRDPQRARQVLDELREKLGGIDLVIQAVVEPVFGRASAMPLDEITSGINSKAASALAVLEAARAVGARQSVVFSSIGAFGGFPGAAGQASYAAGCAFEGAMAGGGRGEVLTLHWGLWSDPEWRQELVDQVRADGLIPMDPDAAFAAFEQALAAHQIIPGSEGQGADRDHAPIVAASLDAPVWRAFGLSDELDPALGECPASAVRAVQALATGLPADNAQHHAKVEACAQQGLVRVLQDAGLLGAPGTVETVTAAQDRLAVLPRHRDLVKALLNILSAQGVVTRQADATLLWHAPAAHDASNTVASLSALGAAGAAAASLLSACLEGLPQLLAGETQATELLFPGGSMARVEPLYRDQPGLESANTLVAEMVAQHCIARGAAQGAAQAGEGVQVIEIGAGTGATTAAIRARIGDSASDFAYLYTDVSPGFVGHGKATHAAPWLRGAVLDISRDPAEQGLATGSFDIAVASNVLHATARLDETLSHTARLLRPGGMLLLNENIRLEAFATLTFGLLDGWWAAQDPDLRLAGGPLLDLSRWRVALRRAGLDVVASLAPGDRPEDAAQVVIVAMKPGQAEAKGHRKGHRDQAAGPAPTAKASPAKVAPAKAANNAAAKDVRELVRSTVADALGLEPDSIDPDQPFGDYGVDSIVSPQIAGELAERLNVALRSTDLFSFPTVTALVAHLDSLGAKWDAPQAGSGAVETQAPAQETAPDPTAAAPTAADPTAPTSAAPPLAAPAFVSHRSEKGPENRTAQNAAMGEAPRDSNDPIAIIGAAARFPDAPNLEAFWDNLQNGRSAIKPITRFEVPEAFDTGVGSPTPIHARWGALIDDHDCFDPLFFRITPAEAVAMDPQQRLLLEEAWNAIENAGLTTQDLAGSRTGVFVGASANSYVGTAPPSLQTLGGSMAILSARLAYFLDLKGPTLPVDTGCSSSLVALSLACDSLRTGGCDTAIVGGVSCNLLSPEILAFLSESGMASPKGQCRAFDNDADGFVPGEGVGVLVLRRQSRATQSGDRIRGLILGAGINQDGRTSGITAPSAASQTALHREVWDQAGITPETIGLIEAHGTGTKLGDPIEVAALSDAFAGRAAPQSCAIGSVKTNIGHAMAAAGMAGLAKALLSLEHKVIAPSLCFDDPNQHIDFQNSPFHVVTERRDWVSKSPRRAAISSFGFSGTNAHVVLQEAPEVALASVHSETLWPIALSAATQDALEQRRLDLLQHLQQHPEIALPDLSWTLCCRRSPFKHRAVWLASDRAELVRLLGLGRPAGVEAGDTAAHMAARTFEQGGDADFMALFPVPGQVVSLPGYPFERARYWAPVTASGIRTGTGTGAVTRTALAVEDTPDAAQPTLWFELSQNAVRIHLSCEDWRLSQHRVQGQAILPAAGSIELICAAIAKRDGIAPAGLSDLVWHRPVRAQEGQALVLSLITVGARGGFEVWLQDGLVAEGRITPADQIAARPARAPGATAPDHAHRLNGATLRQRAAERGIVYGPRFADVSELHWSETHAHGVLRVASQPDAAGLRGTGLLDAAFQVAAGIAGEDPEAPDGLFVPRAIGALHWLQQGTAAQIEATLRQRDAHGAVFDVTISDSAAEPLVRIDRLIARRMTVDEAETGAQKGAETGAQKGAETARTQHLRPIWSDYAVVPQVQSAPQHAQSIWIFGEGPAVPGAQPLTRTDLREGAGVLVTTQASAPDQILLHLPADLAPQRAMQDLIALAALLARLPALPGQGVLLVTQMGETSQGFRALAAGLAALCVEHPGLRAIALSDGAAGVALPDVRPQPGLSVLHRGADLRLRARGLVPVSPVPAPAAASTDLPLEPGDCVVISGGTGGLGMALARALSALGGRVALLARRAPPPNIQAQIDQLGDRALVCVVDLVDPAALSQALAQIRTGLGPIRAVLHLAGTRRDGVLARATAEDLREVFAAKLDGLSALDLATKEDPLHFFAVFGSTSAEFGVFGQALYGGANAAASAAMVQRQALVQSGARQGASVCVAWSLWQDGAMQPPADLADMLRKTAGLMPMPTDVGLRALAQAVSGAMRGDGMGQEVETCVLYGIGDVARGLRQVSDVTPSLGQSAVRDAGGPLLPDAANADSAERETLASRYVTALLAEVAQIPESRVEPEEAFESFGIDSMMITRLNAQLEQDLGPISKTLFYEFRTPQDLSLHLAQTHASALRAHLAPLDPERADPAALVAQTETDTDTEAEIALQPAAAALIDAPIAIIGIAGLYPQSETLDSFWQHLHAGHDLVRDIPPERWALEGFYDADRENISTSHSKWGGFIDGADQFDPGFFGMSPIEAEALDPQARKFLEVAWWALEDAGYTRQSLFARDPDPARRAGGVFVGLMHSDYPLYAAQARATGELGITTSGFWSTANRVSHFLDFQGPSMAVDTACSASLSAIHTAIQSLRSGECTVALAGGVNLSLHPMKYWVLSKAGFASSDGRCRSFGLGGDGYVPGEGAGAVLLKPLSRALADGDRIHAVIRSSAVNHGGHTSGYTVPNPVAQGRLVADAVARAGVPARTLGYIEAHGTGTALGDPIEITGLRRGLAPDPARPIPIGSVKSNIGHLEAAAGIAALSKVVLQMRHGQIAPSLHAETINPDLGLEASGLRVVTTAEPWPAPEGHGRRAGVSSFGAGGANVHLIVEEAPPATPTAHFTAGDLAARIFALPVSAASPKALSAMLTNLAAHLEQLPADETLADVALTLATGREAFAHRALVLARTPSEAATLARRLAKDPSARDLMDGDLPAPMKPLAQAWLRGDAVDAVDWAPVLDQKARRVAVPLYPYVRRKCWLTTRPDPAFEAPVKDGQTPVIPADSALIRDHLVEGAPIAAGALILTQAVARLGLALPLSIRDLTWSRQVPVAKDGLRVDLSQTPEDRVVAMVEAAPALEFSEGEAIPRPAPLAASILAAQWPRQIEGAALYALFQTAGLTYGPAYARIERLSAGDGAALASLVSVSGQGRVPGSGALNATVLDATVLDAALQVCAGLVEADGSGLRPGGFDRLDVWGNMDQVRWVHAQRRSETDAALRVDLCLADETGAVVAHLSGLRVLPVTAAVSKPVAKAPLGAQPGPQPEPQPQPQQDGPPLRLLVPDWRPVAASVPKVSSNALLILTPDAGGGLGAALAEAAQQQGRRVLELPLPTEAPVTAEAITAALAALEADPPAMPIEIVFMGAYRPAEPWDRHSIPSRRNAGTLALKRLFEVLATRPQNSIAHLSIVTHGASALRPDDLCPEAAAVTALAKAAGREAPHLTMSLLDLPDGAPDELVKTMIHAPNLASDAELTFDDGIWWQLGLKRQASNGHAGGIQSQGRYVIAGGSGGLGRTLGRYLAQEHRAQVWLLGRRDLAPDEVAQVQAPIAGTGSVQYRIADLGDQAALAQVLQEAAGAAGRIDGIIHAALVMDDCLLTQQSDAAFLSVLHPKVDGVAALIAASDGLEIGHWIGFSSSNAYTANAGQAAYAAASAYLDTALLQAKAPARVIDWGLWGEVGRMAKDPRSAGLKRMGVWPISTAEGIAAFERVMAGHDARVLALKVTDALLEPMGVQMGRDAPGTRPHAAQAPHPTEAERRALDHFAKANPLPVAFDPEALGRIDTYAVARLSAERQGQPDLTPIASMQRLAQAVSHLCGGTVSDSDPNDLRAELDLNAPEAAPYLALLDQTLPAIADVIEGRRSSADVLFPDGSDALLRPIYQGNDLLDWLQRLAAQAVRAAVTARLSQRDGPVRIVEIGGGTGGTTGFALEALAEAPELAGRVDYLFTDIGAGFCRAAEDRFGHYAGFSTRVLDAARPMAEQAMSEGVADIILAANVVHATPDVGATLSNLGKLLRADGVFVLKEATGVHPLNTLTFGLTAEWWGYTDPERRLAGGPLLSRDLWQSLLQQTGYRGVVMAGLPGDHDGTGAESVIVAAAPPGARATASVGATKRLTATQGDIEQGLITVLAEALHYDPAEISLDGSFSDFGVDSMLSVELVRSINAHFSIEMQTTALFNYATVRELAGHIYGEFASPPASDLGPVAASKTPDTSVASAVHDRIKGLRSRIGARRTQPGVREDAEAAFLAREAAKTAQPETAPQAPSPPRAPAALAPTLDELLRRLEAGEIGVDDVLNTEGTDHA